MLKFGWTVKSVLKRGLKAGAGIRCVRWSIMVLSTSLERRHGTVGGVHFGGAPGKSRR